MNEYMYGDILYDKPMYTAHQVDVAFVVGATFGFLFGFSIAAYSLGMI
jgi:biotin transporter BioY